MGRVDEALNRARGDWTDLRPAEAVSPVQQFPVELGEQPLHRTDTADVEFSAVPPAPAPELNGKVPPIFEHLSGLAGKIVVDENMAPSFREQYRRLAAGLHQAQAQSQSQLKVIMIASAVAAEGKTLTAANLALTLSESYQRRVLLIDADLRRPSLHTLFNLPLGKGLSEGLAGGAEAQMPLRQLSPHLAFLPAGKPMSDPMAGLTSDRMREVIEAGKASFDWVIVDTPPVGLLPDGHLLASLGDGALLIVKAGSTPCDLVQRAIEALGRHRVLGVVLNKAGVDQTPGYGYRYEYRVQPDSAMS